MKANSYVRRRRWTRTRRFIAYNRWHGIRIPPRYKIIDVAVGGVELMDRDRASVAVWMLTSQGRILYRQNVHRLNPEGDCWLQLDNPDATDFNQICCSLLSGQLLAVSWDGRLFQRTKVCKKMPWGVDWEELTAPEHRHVLSVAIGQHSIWAM